MQLLHQGKFSLLLIVLLMVITSCGSNRKENEPQFGEDGYTTILLRGGEENSNWLQNPKLPWWVNGGVFKGQQKIVVNLTIYKVEPGGTRTKVYEKPTEFTETTVANLYQSRLKLEQGKYDFYASYYYSYKNKQGKLVNPGYFTLANGQVVHKHFDAGTPYTFTKEELENSCFPVTVMYAEDPFNHNDALKQHLSTNSIPAPSYYKRPLPLAAMDTPLSKEAWTFPAKTYELNDSQFEVLVKNTSIPRIQRFYVGLAYKTPRYNRVAAHVQDVSFITLHHDLGVQYTGANTAGKDTYTNDPMPPYHSGNSKFDETPWRNYGGYLLYDWDDRYAFLPNLPAFALLSGSKKGVNLAVNDKPVVTVPLYRDFARVRLSLGAEPGIQTSLTAWGDINVPSEIVNDRKVNTIRDKISLRSIAILSYPQVAKPGFVSEDAYGRTIEAAKSIPSKQLMDKLKAYNGVSVTGLTSYPLHSMLYAFLYGTGRDKNYSAYYPNEIHRIEPISQGIQSQLDVEANIATMKANSAKFERYITPQYMGAYVPSNSIWQAEFENKVSSIKDNLFRPTLVITIQCRESHRLSKNSFQFSQPKDMIRSFFIPLGKLNPETGNYDILPNNEYVNYVIIPATDRAQNLDEVVWSVEHWDKREANIGFD